RAANPAMFQAGRIPFDREIRVGLERDAHVIVAAIGEHSKLGPVMGPEHANDRPVAVSNPIFVDVDGGGFQPNDDPLGQLPVKADPCSRLIRPLGRTSQARGTGSSPAGRGPGRTGPRPGAMKSWG